MSKNILIPMDIESQKNHLKSYGLAYWILQNNIEVDWLLNYRGGSFMFDFIELDISLKISTKNKIKKMIFAYKRYFKFC